jgi:hypothetical protein
MAFDQLTGMAATALESIYPELAVLGILGIYIILWFVFLGIVGTVIFVISFFKHDSSFKETFNNTITGFKKIYKQVFKYYIPIIVLVLITGGIEFSSRYLDISTDQYWILTLGTVQLLLAIILIIYYIVIDTTLAKSYYHSIGKKFELRWITGRQIGKIFLLSLIIVFTYLASFAFLGIPLIILTYMIPFLRYPIIVGDTGIIESIKRIWNMVFSNFWNVVYFVTMSGIIIGGVSFLTGLIPILGDVIGIVILAPFSTLLYTEIYYRKENKYLTESAEIPRKGDAITNYVASMRSQGFSDKQIKKVMKKSGYTAADFKKYF